MVLRMESFILLPLAWESTFTLTSPFGVVARKRNLKNAFRLELPVQGRHMVIVDDVVTTGSTVAEIAQLLLRNGAATVQVWCLCRTL